MRVSRREAAMAGVEGGKSEADGGIGVQPETQLNPKKKVFETIQPVSFFFYARGKRKRSFEGSQCLAFIGILSVGPS